MAKTATKEAPIKAAAPAPMSAEHAVPRQGANGAYFDRFGNPISRKGSSRTGEGWNPTPPDGIDYMWIRISVRGNEQYSELHEMMAAGWRPVPHSRHPNLFMATNDARLSPDACILKEGQLLVERPLGMTLQAREEQRREATDQYHSRLRNHGLEVPQGARGVDVSQNPKLRGGTHATVDGSGFTVSSDANYTLADE